MPEFRVRFVGDLGNLAQFDRAIRNSAGESARQLEAANKKVASQVGPITDIFNVKGLDKGLFLSNQKTIIDSYNNTFRQTGDIIRRAITGYTSEFDEAQKRFVVKPTVSEEFIGHFDKRIGDLKAYEQAMIGVGKTEAQINKASLRAFEQQAVRKNQIMEYELSVRQKQAAIDSIHATKQVIDPYDANFGATYQNVINQYKNQLQSLKTGALVNTGILRDSSGQVIKGKIPGVGFSSNELVYADALRSQINLRDSMIRSGRDRQGGVLGQSGIDQLRREIDLMQRVLTDAPNNMAAAEKGIQRRLNRYQQVLNTETAGIAAEIRALEAEIAKLSALDVQQMSKLQRRIDTLRRSNPAYAAARAAAGATPPIDTDLQRALGESGQLRRELLRGGLGGGARPGTSDFQKNLALQEAAVTKWERNIRTGVTTVKGHFRQLDTATGQLGIVESFTADLDKNGKVITRWGGQLSGASGFLRQTARDFAKVVEWTIATTVVIGSLGLAVESVKNINELNASLTRFSITAQLSSEEARNLFLSLGQVAIQTATPLADLINVADDIALATKKAGDSADEWKDKILALTQAVGIFTNLTGEDTVQGADKLSSAFKQLGIAPNELVGVLNKVTAVAGGQAGAINEIITALGGVSEAASAARLTLDEQIAAVQVLSQVTNKSAADIATAFKNLFGSLASPGSEKILSEFNIQLRDAEGNLRPFLAVYREINQALEAGIIPAGRYQDVLRGISGGPRRAPDAAALLSNLPAIDAAIAKAAGASNEALIANAKILDTNNAKIVQLQNAFSITLFERFGEAIIQFTEAMTGFLTIILDLFNRIDPGMLAMLIQLGAITAAGKLLGVTVLKTGGALTRMWKDVSTGIKVAGAETAAFVKQQSILATGSARFKYANQPYAATNPAIGFRQGGRFAGPGDLTKSQYVAGIASGTGSKLAEVFGGGPKPFGIPIKGIAGAGAIALGTGALIKGLVDTEASTKQTIASLLQLGGTLSIVTGAFAPLGVAALGAGTLLSMLGNDAAQAQKDVKASAQDIYQTIQNLNQSQASVKEYQEAQKQATFSLQKLRQSGKTDEQTKIAQADATNKFVAATIALASANREVSNTFDELLTKLTGVGGAYAGIGQQLRNRGRGPNDPLVQELATRVATEILRATNQPLYIPQGGPQRLPSLSEAPDVEIASEMEKLQQNITTWNDSFDPNGVLGELRTLSAENLNQLFDIGRGGQQRYQIAPTEENFTALQLALVDTITQNPLNLNQEQIDVLVKAVQDFLVASDAFIALTTQLAIDLVRIQGLQAVGAITPEQASNATLRTSIAQALAEQLKNADIEGAPTRTGGPPVDVRVGVSTGNLEELINLIQRAPDGVSFKFSPLSEKEIQLLGPALVKTSEYYNLLKQAPKEEFDALFGQAQVQALAALGVGYDDLKEALKDVPGAISAVTAAQQALDEELEDEAAKRLQEAKDNALNKYAQRNASLQQSANSGQFEGNAAGLAQLRAQSEEAYQAELKLIDVINELSGTALSDLQNSLSNVIGLENAALISKENLSAAFIDNAIAAGLSGEEIVKLQDKLANLLTAIDRVSKVRAKFVLEGSIKMDLRQYIAAMKAFRDSQLNAIRNSPFLSPGGAANALGGLKALNDAIAELEAAQAAINDTIGSINKTTSGGAGSNFGQLSSKGGGSGSKAAKAAKAGYDVSTLDLPEEIANAMNRAALIQEAIKRAKELQAKIPGANAEAQNDIVELLKGTQHILEVRGVKDDLLRKALEELAEIERKRLEFETKADTIRRIRVGSGSFAAIANVPVNTKTGVSLGGAEGPINVTLNLNGTVLTPAQLAQFADLVAASLKRQIANG